MDWKYKHFNQQAIFNAPVHSVREVARNVLAGSFPEIEDTADGFIARGHSGLHPVVATFRIASAVSGTQVSVELLVERLSMAGYALWDIGGYYNGQIDKWFSRISEGLRQGPEVQTLVSKTTSGNLTQRGCLAGCAVWLVGGALLAGAGTALDHALFPQLSGSFQGPFGIAASLIALLAGILAFLYFASPDSGTSRYIRARLRGSGNKERE